MHCLSKTVLIDLNNYCKNRCQNIILNIDSSKIYYNRGQYKGYVYILKLTNHIISHNVKIKNRELYNYIKLQKNNLLSRYHKEKSYITVLL